MSKSFALIIAINEYQNIGQLRTPINDANALSQVLKDTYGFEISLCINPEKLDMAIAFEQFKNKVTKEGSIGDANIVIYFAGHGIAKSSERGLDGYLLPKDTDKNTQSWFPMQEMLQKIDAIPCKHTLVILDCCFAGAFRQSASHRAVYFDDETPISRQHFQYYTRHDSQQVLTSTSESQKALDSLGNRNEGSTHSPFAKCLIDGLAGSADTNKDGVLTLAEIYNYLQNRIPIITGEQNNEQNVGLFPLEKHKNGEFLFVPTTFNPESLTELQYQNPYKGLQSYEPVDKQLFFGRKNAIQELKEKVATQALTVVLGASGTGKSSLVKAGIIPTLREKGKAVIIIRPTKNPLSVLRQVTDFDVLVIDQFEELLTQSDEKEVNPFLIRIKNYLEKDKKQIIITLRVDFETQIAKELLEPMWTQGRYFVPLFSAEELREIIITPAARVGRFIEPLELVDDIISEVIHYPGSLPLLSYTMSELFQKCKDDPYRNINRKDYQEMGGVIGALQKTADGVYDSLASEEEKNSLKHLLLRMVSLSGGETAGKRVHLDELVFDDEQENQRIHKIKNLLAENRLIRFDKDNEGVEFIEPAHDALVRTWKRIQVWVKEVEQENILLQNKLNVAVGEYVKAKGNQKEYLWDSNPSLEQTQAVQKTQQVVLNQQESLFIRLSVRAKKRARNIRYGLIGAAFVIISGLAVFSYFKAVEATANAEEAKRQAFVADSSAKVAIQQTQIAKEQTQIAIDSTKAAKEQRLVAVANQDSAKKNLTKFKQATISDYYNRGLAFMDAKNYAAAIQQFNEALKSDNTFKEAIQKKEVCASKLRIKPTFDAAIKQGLDFESKEQFAQAYNRYQDAFKGAYNNDSVNRRINVLIPKMRNALQKLKDDAAVQIDAGEMINFKAAKSKYQKAIEIAKLLNQNTADLEQKLQECEKKLAQ